MNFIDDDSNDKETGNDFALTIYLLNVSIFSAVSKPSFVLKIKLLFITS